MATKKKQKKNPYKYEYQGVITTDVIGTKVGFLVIGSLLGLLMLYSWPALLDCLESEPSCGSFACTIALGLGIFLWFIFNLVGIITAPIFLIAGLFDWSEVPKIKVRVKNE